MNPNKIAARYFDEGRVMQIGTLHDGHPRVNSVYFVASDDNTAVYWMSEPHRRHSQDIAKDPRTSGAIAIKLDHPVAGLQFMGNASIVEDIDELKDSIAKYNNKYHAADDLFKRIIAKTNKHIVYKITISQLELFDEVNFPGQDGTTVVFQ